MQVASRAVPAVQEAWPPQWMLNLERAHDFLHRAARVLEAILEPTFDLEPAAQALSRALERIYAAYDERDDRMTAAHAADQEVYQAITALGAGNDPDVTIAIGFLNEVRRDLDAAQGRLASVIQLQLPADIEVRASNRVPNLHAVGRPSIVPKFQVGNPPEPPPPEMPKLPPPKTVAELKKMAEEIERRMEQRKEALAEERKALHEKMADKPKEAIDVPPGFSPELPDVVTLDGFVHQRTRDCFEEVAMVGVARTPLLGDPFRVCEVLDRRMLDAIDAIAAMGTTAINWLEPYVMDSPAKDPSRCFALAMIYGSMKGRDALAAADRVMRYCGCGSPDVAKAYADALKLAPHPLLPIYLRTLLVDPDPSLRAIAIDVLAYRDLATVQELLAAAVDESSIVVAVALPALATRYPQQSHEAIDRALQSGDVTRTEAAWHAMSVCAHPYVTSALTPALETEMGERAAVALALVAESRDSDRLLELAQVPKPKPGLVDALGWAGDGRSIPLLIRLVERGEKAVRIQAAYALDRITGAQLYENFDLDPEKIVVEEPPEPDLGEPPSKTLAQEVSDPRDLPSEGAPDAMVRPSTEAWRWKEWWEETKGHFQAGSRYRRGHPYTPAIAVWELDQWLATPYERRLLQRELIIRTGEVVRFDPHDFVPIQEEAIRQWEPIARRASGYPGSWTRSMRR